MAIVSGYKFEDLNENSTWDVTSPEGAASEITDVADNPEGLTPDRVDVSLVPESEVTFSVEVTVPETETIPLDLMILQDLSGSFRDDIGKVRNLVPNLVSEVLAVQPDTQFGVASFVDKPLHPFGSSLGDYVYTTDLPLTTDQTLFQTTVNNLATRSGKDSPESQLEALMQVALRAEEVGYRDDSRRVVILATDAPYHQAGDSSLPPNNGDAILDGTPAGTGEDYPGLEQVRSALIGAGIVPVFAVTSNQIGNYQALVDQLGFGTVQQLTTNSSNLVDVITDGLEEAFEDVVMVVEGDDYGYVRSITPAVHEGIPAGETATFEVTLAIDEDLSVPRADTLNLKALGYGETEVNVATEIEPGKAGITIFLDLNNNGLLDPEEPTAITAEDNPDTFADETGYYEFADLETGNYVVREVVPPGFEQTAPEFGFHAVELSEGELATEMNFGNFAVPVPQTGGISGLKWQDLNGNGVRDTGNASSLEETDEGIAINLAPGDDVTFSIDVTVPLEFSGLPLDLVLLQDVSGSFEDDVAKVKNLIPDLAAAVQRIQPDTQFGLSSFVDKPIEPFGIPDEHYIYQTDLALTTDTNALREAIDDLQLVGFGDGPEGQLEALMQVALRQEEVGYREDSRRVVILTTDASYHVAGDGAEAFIFPKNNGDAVLDGTPAGTGEDYPEIDQVRSALIDGGIVPIFAVTRDNIGTYEALVEELGFGLVSELKLNSSNLIPVITEGIVEAFEDVVTVVDGDDFGYVKSVTPSVHENVRPGDTVSFEVTIGTDETTIVPDELVLRTLGFQDTLVKIDSPAPEPILEGVEIYLDLNENGQLDGGEPTTVTDENGLYEFNDLAPGTYMVREVIPEGYQQTSPGAGFHLVEVLPGEIATDVDFGNALNENPVAVDDELETNEFTSLVIPVGELLANDSDSDGDEVLFVSFAKTENTLGEITDNGDGTITYDPNGQFDKLEDGDEGLDEFTYTISDGNGGTATASVFVTILGDTNTAPSDLKFQAEREVYKAGETLALKNASVTDSDGFEDLAEVVFVLESEDGEEIVLEPSVTDFNASRLDPTRATFSGEWPLVGLEPGEYTLLGRAFDRAGAGSNTALDEFEVEKNDNPFDLTFGVKATKKNLKVTKGVVKDSDGFEDLERVEFWVDPPEGDLIFVGALDTLKPVSIDPQRAKFNFNFNFSDFKLNPGEHSLIGRAFDKAGNQSNLAEREFAIAGNNDPVDLGFSLERDIYQKGDILKLVNPSVKDLDGFDNIDRIQFNVKGPSGRINWVNETEFTAHPFSESIAEFEYSVELENFGKGKYTIEARAFDKDGGKSDLFSQQFRVVGNEAPTDLELNLKDDIYRPGDTLSLSGSVFDENTYLDLAEVRFSLKGPDGKSIKVESVTEFSANPLEEKIGEFVKAIDLTNFKTGQYTLTGRAFDEAGGKSKVVREKFEVVESPGPTDLNLELEFSQYSPGDILKVTGSVSDLDGYLDLSHVDMRVKGAGVNLNVADVTSFTPDPLDPDTGDFMYQLDLTGFKPGNYTLQGKAFDDSGKGSKVEKVKFQVVGNPAPTDLEIEIDDEDNIYTVGESLNLSGVVTDLSGFEDIEEIKLLVKGPKGFKFEEIIESDELAGDELDENTASFLTSLDLTDYGPGKYNVRAQAVDSVGGTSNVDSEKFQVVKNFAPNGLRFELSSEQYEPGATLSLVKTQVTDKNGVEDIDRVQFQLLDADGKVLGEESISDFSQSAVNSNRGHFEYNLELDGLPKGTYTLKARAFDREGEASNTVEQTFKVTNKNIAPTNLDFELSSDTYKKDNPLTVINASVFDGNGAEDLERVVFKLQIPKSGKFIKVGEVREFVPFEDGEAGASFKFNLDLTNFTSGKYKLWAQAEDESGLKSDILIQKFDVITGITPPSDFQFDLDAEVYRSGDTLNVVNGLVKDLDGADNLEEIDFWLLGPDGEWQDIDDVEVFDAPESGAFEFATFKYDLNLASFTPGKYSLLGKAFDEFGLESSAVVKGFEIEDIL